MIPSQIKMGNASSREFAIHERDTKEIIGDLVCSKRDTKAFKKLKVISYPGIGDSYLSLQIVCSTHRTHNL
jgi:hypothetical protein